MSLERRTVKRFPVEIPEGFTSLLTSRQRRSTLYRRLISHSELNTIQRQNPLYRKLEAIGVEQEVMWRITIANDKAREEQYRLSGKRISETTAKILQGR